MASELPYARHFRELEVYKKQRLLAKAIFQASKHFPREELYSLSGQIRRSSRSIGAQLAEAWAKRLYPKHWISKLTDADGEQLETQHWLTEAFDCQYISESEMRTLTAQCEEIGRMLGGMIRKAESFRSDDFLLRDEAAPYLVQ